MGVLAQGVPDQGDHAVEHTGGDVAMAPDRVEDLVPAEHLARRAGQQLEHGEGLGLQRLWLARAQQAPARQVQDDVVEAEHGRSRAVHRGTWKTP
ncbi:hypothetical protein D3C80_1753080 [compost metagenome]